MMMIDVVNHFSYSLLNEITTNKETLEFPKLIPTLVVSGRCIDLSNSFYNNLRPDENSLRYHDHDIHKEVKKQASVLTTKMEITYKNSDVTSKNSNSPFPLLVLRQRSRYFELFSITFEFFTKI